MKPIILITADIVDLPRSSGLLAKTEYAKCITAAGGIPLGAADAQRVREYAQYADALVLTGGPIIHVSRYDDYNRTAEHLSDTQRDDLDFALCRAFLEAGKPILGIGRGAQVLNVALGGNLHRKLAKFMLEDGEWRTVPADAYRLSYIPCVHYSHAFGNHPITSRGSRLLPDGDRLVNSYHTQAVDRLGEGLHVTATAPDGTVEAFESDSHPWFGVQWHPEHPYLDYRGDAGLFEKFVEQVKSFTVPDKKPIDIASIIVNGGGALDPMLEMPGWIVCRTYLTAVAAAGGLSLLSMDENATDDYARVADGLLLTGSFSWCPRPDLKPRKAVEADDVRIPMDDHLYHSFLALKKPIFGICLGMQRICQYSGGCISIDFKRNIHVEHMHSEHLCKAEPGSLLHKLFGESFMVNSRHNCRVEEIGNAGLKPVAWAPDGTLEAVEHETLPIYGFQFHPERARGDLPDPPAAPDSTPLFRELMRMALEHRS